MVAHLPIARRFAGSRRVLAALLIIAASLAAIGVDGPSGASPEDNWVRPPNHPGAPGVFDRNFADPTVIEVDGTYFAYATNTGGSHLPVLSSTDLATWSPQLSYNRTTAATQSADSSQFVSGRPVVLAQRPDTNFDPWINDGLLDYHDGARLNEVGHNHMRSRYWAPGVAQIGSGFVAFSSVPTLSDDHRCIRVSTSSSPAGPFVPVSGTAPLQCDHTSTGEAFSPNGSNDPDPFVDGDGTPYLVWKSEGNPNPPFSPTILWARELNSAGTAFAPGSVKRELLRTDPSAGWEGTVIENPSMVLHNGNYYLFYSANEWVGSSYATGYAVCAGPLGPCTRPASGPLMSTTATFVSPGGADAFVDASGQLQLAFHHWMNGTAYEPTQTAYRKMTIAPVSTTPSGTLQVSGFTAPAPAEVTVRYDPAQAGLIQQAASIYGTSPAEFQRQMGLLVSFLSTLQPAPAVPPTAPANTGASQITSTLSASDVAFLNDLTAYWGGEMSIEQALKLSTVVFAFVLLSG